MTKKGKAALVGVVLLNAGTFLTLTPLILLGVALFSPCSIHAFRALAA